MINFINLPKFLEALKYFHNTLHIKLAYKMINIITRPGTIHIKLV